MIVVGEVLISDINNNIELLYFGENIKFTDIFMNFYNFNR